MTSGKHIVKVKKNKLSSALCAMLAVCALSLSGCGTLEPSAQATSSQAFQHLSKSVDEYSELADKSSDEGRFNALILLARAQISAGDADAAQSTAATLRSEAKNSLQKDEVAIIDGLILSQLGNSVSASNALAKVNPTVMNENAARYYHLLNFKVNEKNYLKTKQERYLKSAFRSGRELAQLTSGKDRETVCRRTVALLESVGSSKLGSMLSNSNDRIDRGYFEYALAETSASAEAKNLLAASFSQKYPDHPLNILVNADHSATSSADQDNSAKTSVTSETAAVTPIAADESKAVPVNAKGIISIAKDAKIAVLLPLSGRYAKSVGEPAKLGMLSALNNTKANYKVSFYDTAKSSIDSIVQNIKGNGTALIIGPLLKSDLNTLNDSQCGIPVIALNTPENSRPDNEWYFDLGPDYEGVLAAAKIKADGFKKPLVIATQNRQSARASNAFLKAFGPSAANCNVESGNAQTLSKCRIAGSDSVYLATSAPDAVTFKASLPATIKVYLTDQSYEGFNNSGQQLALKGAMLGEMPWLLSDSDLKASLMKAIPKADTQAQRVFSAGYDSILLASFMQELAKDNQDVLHGLTGDISLGSNGLIESAPLWVELGNVRN